MTAPPPVPLLGVALQTELDVAAARRRARDVARALGFEEQDTTRIATVVSELARNAVEYAGGGSIDFACRTGGDESLLITVRDTGPGIPHLQQILDGTWRSERGLGLGITGARRIMDDFDIQTEPGHGTRVTVAKTLPRVRGGAGLRDMGRIARQLAEQPDTSALTELHQQNHELLQALDELRRRKEEHDRLNRELEDTNRGVVALYADLEQQAEQLRRANELRAQFMSYMSHEFRTPLDSVIALAGILLARVDGDLTDEQVHQVELIRRSALDLLQMVDQLLESARVEAGLMTVHTAVFYVGDVFNVLRATLRPLATNPNVTLSFEDRTRNAAVQSDEGKVTQILRNLTSNALKFTDRGIVTVLAEVDAGSNAIRFSVTDTGPGIPPEEHERIFADFTRIEGGARRVKGTGLGLPFSRKLAGLLGGSLTVSSRPGEGSTFTFTLPATRE